MKTLFIGGVKSGKSRLAEAYILERAGSVKPYYLATAEVIDEEIKARIAIHQLRRQDAFITLEEPLRLLEVVKNCPGPILIECVTMWLNNQLYYQIPQTETLDELEALLQLPNEIVLVHNEVGLGVIPDSRLARQFVDLSGKAAQLMAAQCQVVYFCSAGLTMRMK
jgi:adenosylcobinamide kinase/adenosylcobinamide-phosphate guanylyltransferase